MHRSRLGCALSFALLASAALPASGLGATQVGQSPPAGLGVYADCSANSAHVTRTLSGTNPYIATVSGVITEWQFQADTTGNPGVLALQVLTADPIMNTEFTPLRQTSNEAPDAATLNRFKARLPISAGEYVGLLAVTVSHGCFATVSSGNFTNFAGMPAPPAGGGEGNYGFASGSAATNVSATIEPDADGDGFGDETQDGCLGDAARFDDCVKPTVTIDQGPKKQTKKTKANFSFSSDEAGSTFECSVDGKEFSGCSSPLTVKKLKRKKHTFAVRAVDANSNESAQADYKWKVKKKKRKK